MPFIFGINAQSPGPYNFLDINGVPVNVLGSSSVPATSIAYTPANPLNWQPVPSTVAPALDQLASPNTATALMAPQTNTTVNVVSGNISRKRSGQVNVSGTVSGSVGAGATITLTMLRDATPIGPTLTQTVAAGSFTLDIQWIDTLPDNANHNYTIRATGGATAITTTGGSGAATVQEI